MKPLTLLPASLLLGTLLITPGAAQTALLNYNFNGSGSTAANGGSASNATLTYYSGAAYSSAGSGLSGAGGDTALNNTGAAGMGTLGNSAAGASTATKSVDLGTLGSFTIAGWYKAETTPGAGGKLFELYYGTNSAITLIAEGGDRLALNIAGSSTGNNSTQQTGYSATGSWVFFAMTYNGTTSTNNLSFYIGNSTSLTAAGTRSIAGTSIAFGMTGIGVGNGYNNGGAANRPFDALMDNVSFYGAADSSGALNSTQLDAIRLSSIPEPSSAALLFGGAGLVLASVRRRNRRN